LHHERQQIGRKVGAVMHRLGSTSRRAVWKVVAPAPRLVEGEHVKIGDPCSGVRRGPRPFDGGWSFRVHKISVSPAVLRSIQLSVLNAMEKARVMSSSVLKICRIYQ